MTLHGSLAGGAWRGGWSYLISQFHNYTSYIRIYIHVYCHIRILQVITVNPWTEKPLFFIWCFLNNYPHLSSKKTACLVVVVSNIFYVHPYLGKIPILTNMFQMGWLTPPTSLGSYYKRFHPTLSHLWKMTPWSAPFVLGSLQEMLEVIGKRSAAIGVVGCCWTLELRFWDVLLVLDVTGIFLAICK